MSCAIIRNEKYKRANLIGIYRHNERRNKNYSNKNIDRAKSYLNYSLKEPIGTYEREFDRIREDYNLKGQVKEISNIACEYIITSDNKFFDVIGEKETERFFKTSYHFVGNYKNLGKQYILSAKVHMDEDTPHMHLLFIPVVHTLDKSGNAIDKIACSEFWKSDEGKYWKDNSSYRHLQDDFCKYMNDNGFELERGIPSDRKHLSVEQFKEITNYNEIKQNLKEMENNVSDTEMEELKNIPKLILNRDKEIETKIIEPLENQNDLLLEQNRQMKTDLLKITNSVSRLEDYSNENRELRKENRELRHENNDLKEEVSTLQRIVETIKETAYQFIIWICDKFSLSAESAVKEFEKENDRSFNPVEQIEREDIQLEEEQEEEDEWDM